jgi:XTP/dITP diphosphohydrolase
MQIYVATSNAGKLRDFRAAARDFAGVEIEPLPGLSDIPAPPEDEPTFEGNARAKAIYYSRFAPGAWVVADDSGLEVDALGGRPGVRSARFALDAGAVVEEGGTDAANNAELLKALDGEENRSAHYRCALALAADGVVEVVTFGRLDGEILTRPAGTDGFGYDPLFYSEELESTMAEAPMENRMRVSHRGRALRALLRRWAPC